MMKEADDSWTTNISKGFWYMVIQDTRTEGRFKGGCGRQGVPRRKE